MKKNTKRSREIVTRKKDLALVRKAFAVSADPGDSDISSYLPLPLALQVIEFIRDLNVMRRLVRTFPQTTRSWKKPKKMSGLSAYYIPDGVQATESGFTSSSVTWEAKKLMSYIMVDAEAIEDSQPDLLNQILQDFSEAVAQAEESAILSGDTTHLATAPDVASATSTNWYVRDPRLMFDGIFPVAAADGADSVDGNNTVFDMDMVNLALYNLGKYARNRTRLIGLIPPEQAANVRGNANFGDAAKTGLPLSAFITGLGAAGEADGVVAKIHGVNFYEAPFAPTGQGVVMNRDTASMGDRRKIKFRNSEIIEQDQTKYVVSERISFNYDYRDAMVLIDNLSETILS